MTKTIIGTLVIMLTLVLIMLFFTFEKKDSRYQNGITSYEVVQKWELPDQLEEISAIEWLGDGRIAAVQDEDGIIFIYDLNKGKIEKEINFGEGGDYEGLSISEGTAYVLRSDGTVFEVRDYLNSKAAATALKTSLADIKGIDVEGLSLDKGSNSLLLAVKENKQEKNSRGIYSFDLGKNQSEGQPLFRISLSDPIFKKEGEFNPSEIEIHPSTGEYYILDAQNHKLLITGKDGKPKKVELLDKNDFSQPEGLTFTPEGVLYISNEAGDGPANILQVNLN